MTELANAVSEDNCRWLTSPAASPYLERATEESCDLVRLTRSLRQVLTAERVNLILEQVSLRRQAREKFSLASEMFLLRKLLEQSTEERIAVYKAIRFPTKELVADLCCGLGGDMIGLGSRGPVLGIDCNPAATVLAAANSRIYGHDLAATKVGTVEELWQEIPGPWHIDPDRRATGNRTTQHQYFAPGIEFIDRLCAQSPHGAVKLAAATVPPPHWESSAELEWIGSRRECRQQVAWFGSLAKLPGARRATVIDPRGVAYSVTGQPDLEPDTATYIGPYICEPHAAVLAARLSGALASQHALRALSAGLAYLTCDTPASTPLLATFEVVETLPFDVRRLKAVLRARSVGRLEIKVRGVDVVPDQLRKKLDPRGDNELTVLIAGTRSNTRAILAKRWSKN